MAVARIGPLKVKKREFKKFLKNCYNFKLVRLNRQYKINRERMLWLLHKLYYHHNIHAYSGAVFTTLHFLSNLRMDQKKARAFYTNKCSKRIVI